MGGYYYSKSRLNVCYFHFTSMKFEPMLGVNLISEHYKVQVHWGSDIISIVSKVNRLKSFALSYIFSLELFTKICNFGSFFFHK